MGDIKRSNRGKTHLSAEEFNFQQYQDVGRLLHEESLRNDLLEEKVVALCSTLEQIVAHPLSAVAIAKESLDTIKKSLTSADKSV